MKTCSHCGYASDTDFHFCPSCGTKALEGHQSDDPLPGKTLNGKYRVIAPLGAGSMGTVYLGEHVGLRKKVALKVLHTDLQVDDETLTRFQREGIAAGQFTHPNAIQIFDFDRHDERVVYLAMEYVEGVDLKAYIRAEGPLPLADALRITRQILSVLSMAHAQGIVHRDLKPENIMVVRGSGDPDAKVLDFGLSKLIDRPLEASMQTQVGRIIGTPLYMSPEQCAGQEVDHRTDLYATGLIVYEMLAGEPPFRGETVTEIFSKHISQDAPTVHGSNPDVVVPSTLDAFLVRALEKDRDARFPSADEMLAALDEVEGGRSRSGSLLDRRPGRSGSVAPLSRPASAAPRARVGSGKLALGLGALALVALLGVFVLPYLTGPARSDVPRLSMRSQAELDGDELRYLGLLDATRSAVRQRDATRAFASVDDALQLAVADSEAYYLRALTYRLKGDDDTARADLAEALRLDPGYADAQAQLGWIELDRGASEEAEAHLAAALALDERCVDALSGRAALHFEQGQLVQARELLERAVGFEPDAARAHEFLGRVQLAQDDTPSAIGSFIEAKRSDQRLWGAWAGLGAAYLADGDLDKAETQLVEAARLAPEEVEPSVALAELWIEKQRFDDADELLSATLQKNPGTSRAQLLRGIVHAEHGDTSAAIAALGRGLESDPTNVDALLLIGVLELRSGRMQDAATHFEAVLEQDPYHATAWLDLGLARFHQRRPEDAREALERAVDLDPEALEAHYALGIVFMDYLAEPARAREHLRRYRELGGADERADDWLVRLPE